jgi:hypothetical protein
VKTAFLLMWLTIIGISVHDGFLVLSNRIWMVQLELNPIGRWLIFCNDGDIWFLLAAKLVGTHIASSILLWFYWLRPRLGWPVCAAVCLLQLMLLIFLYAESQPAPGDLSAMRRLSSTFYMPDLLPGFFGK